MISDPNIIMIPTVVWEQLLGKFLWIFQPLSSLVKIDVNEGITMSAKQMNK